MTVTDTVDESTRSTAYTDPLTAARHVAEALAPDVLERDRAGAEPTAEADLLRRSGLLGLLLPTSVGGGGGRWSHALAAVGEIARVDGSIAQLLAYHYVNVHNLVWVASDEALQRFGSRSVRQGWLWGDAVNPTDPDLTLIPAADGGYVLTGRKNFATGASVGDVTLAGGVVEGTGEPLVVVVERDQNGFDRTGGWDNLGQRLSASGAVAFDDVTIVAEAVLGRPDAKGAFSTLVTPAIQAMFGSLYLGITRGALHTAAAYTRETSRPWLFAEVDRAVDDPYVLATYGRLVARLRAAEALLEQVGDALDEAHARGPSLSEADRGEVAELIAALKVVASDLSLEATSAVFEVTGARASSNRVGLDRFWRNVRTHTLHDPVSYKAREVGAHFVTGTYPAFSLYT